ncbi:MAG: UPF0182 family protein [Gemmatimonadaceae bacterium]|nr:UPF0182 family protein [Gemmatimonadaceae bacterium]
MTARRGLFWLVAGLALTLLVGRWVAGVYADWAFHRALGSDAVWRARVMMSGSIRLVVFLGAFAVALANLIAVRRSIISLVLPRRVGNLEIGEQVPPSWLTGGAFGLAFAIAALFAAVDHDWTAITLAFNALPFGEIEPYLERDLSFYVTWLPFERWMFALMTTLHVVVAIIVLVIYLSTPSVRWGDGGLYVSTWVRRHLGVLVGLAIVLVAWDWRLDRFGLLSVGSGDTRYVFETRPFGVVDHRVLLPYLAVASFAALPVAAVFALATWRGATRLAFGLLTLLLIGGPVAHIVLPTFAESAAESPARRRSYQNASILYTRRAYGVDRIATTDTFPLPLMSDADLARRTSSWDPAALRRYVARERRGTDVAAFSWRVSGSNLEALLLRGAPPEAPAGARWPADVFSASTADAGAPDAGLVDAADALSGILVYPGAPRYVLVADTAGRLAAPPFGSGAERLAHAWDQQNPRLLALDPIAPRPRIVTHRDAVERVARVAPFLTPGETITPVVRGDSLYWVFELFVRAREYPLAVRTLFAREPAHYVHHAATAVVQAQSGSVTLLAIDAPEPVMRAWMARFPSLFVSRANAPRWMTTALPPATDWTLVQGAMLGRTGVAGDTVPIRSLARIDDADADLTPGPPTLFQVTPDGTLGWGVPVLGQEKVVGLLVSVGGVNPRTVLLPSEPGQSWESILENLQETADDAGFGRALPNARRGRVQAIPTATGNLFVQSFYEWPTDGPPRLLGVTTLRRAERRHGATLGQALGASSLALGSTDSGERFRGQALMLYEQMLRAQRRGDWRAYGEALDALGRLLRR